MTESEQERYAMRIFTQAFPDLTHKEEEERRQELLAMTLKSLERPRAITIFDLED